MKCSAGCGNVILFSSRLGVKSGGCAVYHKTNRETMVEIGDSVRGKDIYIIQTGTKYVAVAFST
jgi:phosphoribosylpyrophosphate synthetase